MPDTNKETNNQQNYSWKGSWDAGTALMILVGALTVVLFVAGFAY
ncbi:MAG: hypothetical protein AAFP20_18050 [Cyanobacteria bacterium J06614_10]